MKISKLFLITGFIFLTSCTSSEKQSFTLQNPIGSMKLEYANQFSVDYYENNFSLISIADGEKYLVVPPDNEAPENLPDDITIIRQPVKNIYMPASSAVDLIYSIDSLDSIFAVSTSQNDWSLKYMQDAMENGDILYAGKYSSPDYEMILSNKCGLAVESTMIYHTPQVREQLQNQGIPVMTERSSYEQHPLGRMEWIKLYGLILGKESEAEKVFDEKSSILKNIESAENTGKTAVFFYITSNGSVSVRKPGDYISKMIELAGGKYILDSESLDVDENALSTMNMQFESFYSLAKDADYIIYNSTVDGGLSSVDELIRKNSLMSDFKAVKNNNVWCTDKNMFQQTSDTAEVISDMHKIFSQSKDETEFLYHIS